MTKVESRRTRLKLFLTFINLSCISRRDVTFVLGGIHYKMERALNGVLLCQDNVGRYHLFSKIISITLDDRIWSANASVIKLTIKSK